MRPHRSYLYALANSLNDMALNYAELREFSKYKKEPTNMKTQHTPGPWKVRTPSDCVITTAAYETSQNIAKVYNCDKGMVSFNMWANAEHIVKCVNERPEIFDGIRKALLAASDDIRPEQARLNNVIARLQNILSLEE